MKPRHHGHDWRVLRYHAAVLAEIVTIGDELCRGEIVDSNSSWLAAELWELGIPVAFMTSCRDDAKDMTRVLQQASERADVILVSGGLGPTEDDIPVDVIAEVAGVGISVDEPSFERMTARFERGKYTLTPNNLRQVRVPRMAIVLANSAGIAPGFELRLGKATLFAMPGVPRELEAIFNEAIRPRLKILSVGTDEIARRVLRVFGLGESHIDHRLAGLSGDGVTLHYQVVYPETLVKIVGPPAKLDALVSEVRARLGEAVYGEGDDSLAGVLISKLVSQQVTLAVAESCTGGMLGALLTDVSGSSAAFHGGFIVYANEAKLSLVSPELLARHGAVSAECVIELAHATQRKTGATYAIAISGIAGPTGGTQDKPVGTVHIAVLGNAVKHKQFLFSGTREQVRRVSAYWAMALLLREVST